VSPTAPRVPRIARRERALARLVPRSGKGNDRSINGGALMTRRTLLTLLALVLALVMTAAACGGGDDDSAESSSSDDTAADETSTDDDADPSSSDDTAADETSTEDPDAGTEAAGEGDEGSGGAPAEGDVSTQLGVDREFTGDDSDAFCAEVVGMR